MIPQADPPPDLSSMTPGIGALVVFIFLIVAVLVLYRSLRKQLNRVDFPEPEQEQSKDGAGGS